MELCLVKVLVRNSGEVKELFCREGDRRGGSREGGGGGCGSDKDPLSCGEWCVSGALNFEGGDRGIGGRGSRMVVSGKDDTGRSSICVGWTAPDQWDGGGYGCERDDFQERVRRGRRCQLCSRRFRTEC
ncbi:hypothetical protein P152DRAFT_455327 [Eremomyces bilateralis CBS 781.70]|uniref:Uncharacterized protein n=1 Tax=Eremomyces bilateralis CBS 781.70 TaxID=1392243 RepID=A0A6G1GCI4_9PEZI|nr:uncharacterized protein P152DRAFT_455327 [Eremomyces bilateralis CBS 781.70]KAF1815610.1 hypothetical protein P152DRAFT_455327 [Eremomyces bilateralis CBS 781.70]